MQTVDIEREVNDFVITNFLFGEPSDLRPDESLLAKGVIDSTGVLELVAFLEDNYMIKVEDQEVIPDNLDSIRNVASYVAKKLNTT
jgi:acyl carrier protein